MSGVERNSGVSMMKKIIYIAGVALAVLASSCSSYDDDPVRKRIEDLNAEIERLEKKLSNAGFVAKAPAAVVDGEKAKLAKYQENLAGVREALAKLG